VEHGDSRK
jgi:hypothetical protein